jgi:ATP-dependent helicase/nuclease subunit A
VLGRLQAHRVVDEAGAEPVELEQGDARFLLHVDRGAATAPGGAVPSDESAAPVDDLGQLALFAEFPDAPTARGYVLQELLPVPAPPLHRVRQLSYSALALFDRCSYRYYAERVAGLREAAPAAGSGGGLAATEIGDAVHRLLELVDLREPRTLETDRLADRVKAWYPHASGEELVRIEHLTAAYCGSALALRIAGLDGAAAERPFAFEHDGVLVHGRLDVLWLHDGRALVLDYKTNALGDASPDEIVEAHYRLQRLVYALACLRAGADEVEVVYQFLERPEAIVTATFVRAGLAALETELSRAIARIDEGEFAPTPAEFTCSGCPALDLVCAGPRLGQSAARDAFAAA